MQIIFSQPSLIIFTKVADIFGHDCIYIYIVMAKNIDTLGKYDQRRL